jgi:hypothetical protein
MAIKAYDATTDAELDAMIEESRRNPKAIAIDAKYLPATDQSWSLTSSRLRFARFRRV